MEEKILQTKKNGMLVLMLTLLGFVLDVIAFVFANPLARAGLDAGRRPDADLGDPLPDRRHPAAVRSEKCSSPRRHWY